ncbi:MAG TPA: histidine kinase dimerization/phosphoacceptor domain -containing protein [Devosiaceae bacterium]|jgi:two-component sensor histidine kinase|nr:histidine kinase dimerization/phosphoacceptor domain -containing protein [Devosiaceae bacterium]
MSLRRRLFLLGGLTLLPVIGLLAYDQIDLRQNRERELHATATDLARDLAQELQRIIEGGHNVLFALAQMPEIRGGDGVACSNIVSRLLPSYEGFLTIAATRPDGSVFCAADKAGSGGPYPSPVDRYYYQQAVRTGAFTVGRFVRGRVSQTPGVHMAIPYAGLDESHGGVIFASISLDWLAEKMQRASWSEDRAISIVDSGGTILVRQPKHAEFVGQPFPPELWERVRAATVPGVFDAVSPFDGVDRIVGFVPPAAGPGGLYVGVGLGREAAFAPLNLASLRAIVGVALAAALSAILAHFAGKRLLQRPLEDLLRVTHRWRKGDFDVRAPESSRTEFGQLGAAFNSLAGELQQAMRHKDDLLRELSHRVMNSLMSISGVIRLQARKTSSQEAAEQLVQAANRVNSLALVYRQMHVSDGIEMVEISTFLHELCADIGKSLLGPEGACYVDAEKTHLSPRQASLLAIITNELMTNAVKHGGGATAKLHVRFDSDAQHSILAVRNSGRLPPGFDPATAEGFGVAMVSRLAGELGGQLQASEQQGEIEFSVRFPHIPAQGWAPDEPTATAA